MAYRIGKSCIRKSSCMIKPQKLSATTLTPGSHLKPGSGHIEQVEIDLKPRCDDGPVPEILGSWYHWMQDSTNRAGRPIEYYPNTADILRSQGFVDVRDEIIRMPFNTWPRDTHSQDVGRWYNCGFREGLEALSLGPLTRVYKWPVEDVKRLVEDVKKAVSQKQYHVYNNLCVGANLHPTFGRTLANSSIFQARHYSPEAVKISWRCTYLITPAKYGPPNTAKPAVSWPLTARRRRRGPRHPSRPLSHKSVSIRAIPNFLLVARWPF